MATLTESQVMQDVRKMLTASTLAENISGEVYLSDAETSTRPRDSRKEDAEVIFVTGSAEQIQTGVVLVKVYVIDVDPYDNGVLVADYQRLSEVQTLAQQWVESLSAEKSCYRFSLQQTINSGAEPDISQHYVAVRLHYDYYND